MTAPGRSRFDWAPYHSCGSRAKIREFITRGSIEYEQCMEGGTYLIRRTERNGDAQAPTVMEIGRGSTRVRVLDHWRLIVSGDAS